MSPVYKLSANSVKNGRTVYGSMLAGNTAYTPPSWYDSLATVTVGSGGSANVEFTSIPSTYTHLQVRGIIRTTASDADGTGFYFTINSDTNANYAEHRLYATGSAVTAAGSGSSTLFYGYRAASATQAASSFGTFVMDLLDYKNTNKYKTFRGLGGYDDNSTGRLALWSGLWQSTSAVTTIKITPNGGNWAQYSHFALYGIKVAS